MKKISSFFMVALLSMLSVGCSSDNDEISGDNDSLNESDKFYMSIKVEVPTDKSGRSNTNGDGTSSDGTEVGQDDENKINNVTVLLVDRAANQILENGSQSDKILLASEQVKNPNLIGGNQNYTVPFNANKIKEVMKGAKEKTVTIWVICNAGNIDITENKTTLSDLTKHLSDITNLEEISLNEGAGNFLMTNAEACTKTLNSDNFSRDKLRPYNLGTVKVERAVARFDYKVKEQKLTFNLNENTPYDGYTASVELQKAARINMSKNFYLFKRVSIDGTTTNGYYLAGNESGNYVVDTDAEYKKDVDKISANITEEYFFNQYNDKLNVTSLDFVKIPTKAGNTNATQGSKPAISNEDYARLFYCTENTIPQASDKTNLNQKKGITTGIVFKAQIKVTGTDVATTYGVDVNNPKDDTKIYAYNGKLYGTWAKVEENISKDNSLKAAYEAAGGKSYEESADTLKAIAAKFTIFTRENISKSKYGYFTYYYYWNRHNDNTNPEAMGPMEFGVVRNNVYKLNVSKIRNFGHPVNNTLDPNPIEPNDPDEDSNYYFEVNVEVQPWVVRVNDIEF